MEKLCIYTGVTRFTVTYSWEQFFFEGDNNLRETPVRRRLVLKFHGTKLKHFDYCSVCTLIVLSDRQSLLLSDGPAVKVLVMLILLVSLSTQDSSLLIPNYNNKFFFVNRTTVRKVAPTFTPCLSRVWRNQQVTIITKSMNLIHARKRVLFGFRTSSKKQFEVHNCKLILS